jgi:outer membrane receptor protein involved in Fe transport
MSFALLFLATAAPEEAIVITGRGLPDEPPGQHRIVKDRDDLDRAASGRMEDVVRSVAGLTSFRRSDARTSHPTAQGLTARGLGGNAASRFGLEVDGVPQADPFGGWINFVALDPALVDRLVLARGGQGAVRFGPSALAGTLAIDSIADTAPRTGLAYGSRDSLSAFATAGVALGAARLVGGVSHQRGDGFAPIVASDRGPVDRAAPFAQTAARLRLLAPLSGTELQASIAAFEDERDRGVDFTDNRARGLDASLRLVGKQWSLTGYWQKRQFVSSFASVGADRASVSQSLDQYKVPATGWGARALWTPRIGALEMGLGADLRVAKGETNERYSFVAGIPTRDRRAGAETLTAGLLGDVRWTAGAVTLGLGARLDRWMIRNSSLFERTIGGATLTDSRAANRDGWQPSYRAGIDWRASEALALRAAAYRGWRLPTINELVRPFRVGPDATAANALLAPEKLVGVETGFDWRPAEPMRISLTAYANRLEDAVANVPLANGPGVFPGVGFVGAAGVYRQRRNLDAIRAHGIELDGGWDQGPWSLDASVAWTRARIRTGEVAVALDGEKPAQVPAWQASLSGAWREGRRLAGIAWRYTGAQDENEGDAEPLPASWTLDAALRWPLTRRWSLDLRAENLLDRRVLTSILNDGTRERATPRTLWIGLRLN